MLARTLTIALAAGLCAPAMSLAQGADPTPIPRFVKGVPIAQIHINLSTGERSVVPWGSDPRGASEPLWLHNNTDPCLTGGTVGIVDDPDTDGDGFGELFGGACVGGTYPCEGMWSSFWGDLHRPDSVIDRIVIRYGTSVPDVDLDSDGVGDGVPGFDMYVSFADNDNGFGADGPGASGRSCIIELCLADLPGLAENLPPGFVAVYELVIDLGQTAPSLVFELGDSDGIDDAGTGFSGAAIYGEPTYADLDGDIRHDFSWGYRFDQSKIPQAQRGATGWISAAPKFGEPGDLPDHPADAVGVFNGVDDYASGPSCPPDAVTPYIGSGFFGYSCFAGTPFNSSFIELYGSDSQTACPRADNAEPFGVLDFTDVLGFLTSPGLRHSYAQPYLFFDISDVIEFLEQFAAGCP